MFGKFYKNQKSFNILFSSLTFGLISLLLVTSFYILITTMLFKNNYVSETNNAIAIPNLYYDYQNMEFTVIGIILLVLVGLSFLSIISYSIVAYLFAPNCLKKWPIVWTLGLLSFSIFVMFILTILGHSWQNNNGKPHVIVQSFLLNSKGDVQYGGASITVLLFDIVIYCCSIISITKIIIDFVKLSKNGYIVEMSDNNNN